MLMKKHWFYYDKFQAKSRKILSTEFLNGISLRDFFLPYLEIAPNEI